MSEEKTYSIEIRAVENGWFARKNAGSDYYSQSSAGTYVFNDPRKLAMWVASQLEPNIEWELLPKCMYK